MKYRDEQKETEITPKDIGSFFVFQPKTIETKASQTNVIELSDTEKD